MALTAQESCENVLQSVKSSNLNFLIQESPFSVYLTIRKRFLKIPKKSPSAPVPPDVHPALNKEIYELRNELNARNNLLEETLEENEDLKIEVNRLQKLANELHNHKSSKETDYEILHRAHNNLNIGMQKVKSELAETVKSLKVKEKEVFTLTVKNENLKDASDRLKAENSTLMSEKKKIEKKKRQAENKIASNNNNSKPSSLQTSVSLKLQETTEESSCSKSPSPATVQTSIAPPSIPQPTAPTPSSRPSCSPTRQPCTTSLPIQLPASTTVTSSVISLLSQSLASTLCTVPTPSDPETPSTPPRFSLCQNKISFRNFLSDFKDENNEYKYVKLAKDMISYNMNVMHISIADIKQYNQHLSENIQADYLGMISSFHSDLKTFMSENVEQTFGKDFYLSINS